MPRPPLMLGLGVVAVGAATLGAFAGLDAGSQVDAFYHTSPAPRYAAAPVAQPADSYRDWAESATYPTSMPASLPASVVPERAVAFDDGFTDRPVQEPRVRVHRAARDVEEAPPRDPVDVEKPQVEDVAYPSDDDPPT